MTGVFFFNPNIFRLFFLFFSRTSLCIFKPIESLIQHFCFVLLLFLSFVKMICIYCDQFSMYMYIYSKDITIKPKNEKHSYETKVKCNFCYVNHIACDRFFPFIPEIKCARWHMRFPFSLPLFIMNDSFFHNS